MFFQTYRHLHNVGFPKSVYYNNDRYITYFSGGQSEAMPLALCAGGENPLFRYLRSRSVTVDQIIANFREIFTKCGFDIAA